jgi:hypothetical protein
LGSDVFPKLATTAVGDRPFLTELLVLSLAAALAWPGLASGAPPSPAYTANVLSQAALNKAGILGKSRQIKPLAERDASTPRGVLDDDPVILADSSEEWIEGSTSFTLPAGGEFISGALPVTTLDVNLIKAPAPPHAALIDLLCTYQC